MLRLRKQHGCDCTCYISKTEGAPHCAALLSAAFYLIKSCSELPSTGTTGAKQQKAIAYSRESMDAFSVDKPQLG